MKRHHSPDDEHDVTWTELRQLPEGRLQSSPNPSNESPSSNHSAHCEKGESSESSLDLWRDELPRDQSDHTPAFQSIRGTSAISAGRRYWAVGLYALTTILLYADQNLLSPNLTAIADEFDFTDQERDQKLGGDIALAFFVLGAPAALLIGCWADQSPHRSALFALVVIIGEGACFITYFTDTYQQLYLCRAVTGFSVGGALPLIYSVLGDLFPADQRHAVSAVVGIGTGVGIALGQGLAGFLGPTFGWRLPFLVVSIPALVCAVLVACTVGDPERGGMEKVVLRRQQSSFSIVNNNSRDKLLRSVRSSPNGSDFYGANDDTVEHEPGLTSEEDNLMEEYIDSISDCQLWGTDWKMHRETFLQLLSTPSVVLLLMQGAPGCLPWGIVNTYLNDFLSENRGMSIEKATLVVLLFGLGTFGGLLVGGAGGLFLYKRSRKLPSLLAGSAAIFGCFPFWMVLNTVHPSSNLFYTVFITVLAGVGAGATGPIVKATLQNVTLPQARGQAFAIFNTFDDFGRGLGPVFVAHLIALLGRTKAFNVGVLGWIVCGCINLLTYFTVERDEDAVQSRILAMHEQKGDGVIALHTAS